MYISIFFLAKFCDFNLKHVVKDDKITKNVLMKMLFSCNILILMPCCQKSPVSCQ